MLVIENYEISNLVFFNVTNEQMIMVLIQKRDHYELTNVSCSYELE